MSANKRRGIALTVSIVAIVLLVLHLLLPAVEIDLVALILLVVAVLPWVAPVVKSVELPGGFKIELQDVKEAVAPVVREYTMTAEPGEYRISGQSAELEIAAKAELGAEAEVSSDKESTIAMLRTIAGTDSNLALVGFRIELEKRLRTLAELKGLNSTLPLSRLLQDLQHRELIISPVGGALANFIALGNQAAHGKPVEPEAAQWVLDEGVNVLEFLDTILGSHAGENADGGA